MYRSNQILRQTKQDPETIAGFMLLLVIARGKIGPVRPVRFSDLVALGLLDFPPCRRLFEAIKAAEEADREEIAAHLDDGRDELWSYQQRLQEALLALEEKLSGLNLANDIKEPLQRFIVSTTLQVGTLPTAPAAEPRYLTATYAVAVMQIELALSAIK